MPNKRFARWIIWFSLAATGYAAEQYRNRIGTGDTTVELASGPSAPALIRVQQRGGQGWQNEIAEELISFVEIDGRRKELRWRFDSNSSKTARNKAVLNYECVAPHLRLRWIWMARGTRGGPIEHTIEIQNLGLREISIPLQDSFKFSFPVAPNTKLTHSYIDKGAGKPQKIGTHREEMATGYRWRGTSSTYAQLFRDEPPEVIPWFAIEDRDRGGAGWYVGAEFSGRTRLECKRTASAVEGVVGLNGEPGLQFRTRLKPGETFATPTIFVGTYRGGLDGMGNVLKPWVREVLGNPQIWQDRQYPLLVNNSWGSGMKVDESLAKKMIRDAADLGLEMFHIDAGWFRGVGDWHPDEKKFPHGLASIANAAHQQGLRFGIWVDWTQAGISKEPGALNVHDPNVRNWTISDVPTDWRPQEFKGITVDLGVPAAKQYAAQELNRLVKDYRLDMLEHDGYLVAQGCVRKDHPHLPPDLSDLQIYSRDGNSVVKSANSTDVSYHATRSYYELYEQLRQEHPHLLLEICNDGGRAVDFGSAAHGDYFSITDTYDPLSNRQAFYDASYLLPPAMLETYVENWPAPRIENFRYMLRSGMMGWLTLMLDTTKWNSEQRAAAKAEVQLYKDKLRPLIRDAALYHVGPRPDGKGWDGIQYFDPKRETGVLYAFRGSGPNQTKVRYRLMGIAPGKNYRMHFQDASSPDSVASGGELLKSGVAVNLKLPQSSELVFFESDNGGVLQR